MPISFQNPTNLILPKPLKRPEVQFASGNAFLQAMILVCMDSWLARVIGGLALVGLIGAIAYFALRKE